MFGPRMNDVELIEELCARYRSCWGPVAAPPKDDEGNGRGEVLNSPWLPDGIEKSQQDALLEWYIKYGNLPLQPNGAPPQETEWLSEKKAAPYLPWNACPRAALHLFPSTCPATLIGKTFAPGDCSAYNRSAILAYGKYKVEDLEHSSLPPVPEQDSNVSHPEHFIFHPGGRVLSLAWAPTNTTSNSMLSLLAVAVIPHHDPASENRPSEDEMNGNGVEEPDRIGSVQFWWLPLYKRNSPPRRGSESLPKMHRLSCFSWGWPKRMEWCPVTPPDAALPFLLALLTEDGIVRVIQVTRSHSHRTTYGTSS